jgi:hypothetical protein
MVTERAPVGVTDRDWSVSEITRKARTRSNGRMGSADMRLVDPLHPRAIHSDATRRNLWIETIIGRRQTPTLPWHPGHETIQIEHSPQHGEHIS